MTNFEMYLHSPIVEEYSSTNRYRMLSGIVNILLIYSKYRNVVSRFLNELLDRRMLDN